MNEPFDFEQDKANAAERIVYVRPVQVADLPPDMQARAKGLSVIWAVHDADGERLALVADRRLAMVLARQHDMVPVSLH
jgi:hypothetical protein